MTPEAEKNNHTCESSLELLVLFTLFRGETLQLHFLFPRLLSRRLLVEFNFPG